MTKQEFLSASLPYGQKYYHFDGNRETEHICLLTEYRHDEFTIADNEQEYYLELKNMIPIIRPLDSLTKECVQSDYNEGNPFVPIVELNKLFDYKDVEIVYYINNGLGWRIGGCFANTAVITDMMLIPICQMLKWHFWPNMPEGEEVVYVSDNFNPYK